MTQLYEYNAVALPTRDQSDGAPDSTSREQHITALLNDHAADGWRVIALQSGGPAHPGYALLERPTLTKPENDGAPWDESDYLTLAEGLLAGLDPQDLATTLGRTTGAVDSRAGKLLRLIGHQDPKLEDLRDVLARGRNILDLARDVHITDRRPLWTRADDDRLRQAWTDRSPALSALAAEFSVTRNMLIARLVRIGLATDKHAAEAQLGRVG